MNKLLLSFFAIFLFGCTLNTQGGFGRYDKQEVITTTQPNGEITKKEIKTTVDLKQPNDPKNPGIITINDESGNPIVTINTGTSYSIATITSGNKLLQIGTFFALGLIVSGGLIAWLSKNIKIGLIMSGAGVGIFILCYLLSQYAWIFLIIGILIFVGLACYLLKDYFKQKVANEENVALIETGLQKGIIKSDEFKTLASVGQSDSTKKIVDKVQDKLESK